MATKAEIRDWVRQQTLIEEDDFAKAKLNLVIDQAVHEVGVAHDWPFLQTSATILLENGADSYAFPTGLARVIGVYHEDGTLVPETSRRYARAEWPAATPASPEAWYFFGEELVFVPSPADYETVTVDYIREPAPLATDSDSPEWHPAYHMIVAEFAAHKIWEREEDLERSGYHRQLFEIGLERMKRHYMNRGADAPMIIGGRLGRFTYPWSWQGE